MAAFDKDGIPRVFGHKHLLNRLKGIESDIHELEESLARRYQREPGNIDLEVLSLRLREASRYEFRLRLEVIAQKNRKLEEFKE
jgi:hypothetical protein